MRLVSFVCIIALAQFAIAAEDGAEARKKLVGVWKGGVEDGAQGHVLTITPKLVSCVRVRDGKETDIGGGTVKLDLSKKPFRMDATGTTGGQKGRAWFGIYSLEGDTLKYCVNSKQPPKAFKTGDGNFCLVLKRQKEKDKTSSTTTKPRVDKRSQYAVAELEESAPAQVSEKVRRTLADSGLRILSGDQVVCDIWLRVDVPTLKGGKRADRNYSLESGELLGVLRVSKKAAGDFRNLKIAPDVYTLRYGLQPLDDIHEFTKQFRDFLVLLSAKDDTDPARVSNERDLAERGIDTTGESHPAILYLKSPVRGRKELPAIVSTPGSDANTMLQVLAATTTAKGNPNRKAIQIELVMAGYAKE
ncbi:MAG: TIGR03067 domain-containing protein [Pirellulaceae bacterium]|jgi:uncharacterized protein (TIGR03067 family)|nr:TIGR03067 domain-containing protein [Pirellulaceae bacterium]